jgi:hypothetical protein
MAFASVKSDLTVIEPEFALLLLRPVALHAMLLKDRLNLRLEGDGGTKFSCAEQG